MRYSKGESTGQDLWHFPGALGTSILAILSQMRRQSQVNGMGSFLHCMELRHWQVKERSLLSCRRTSLVMWQVKLWSEEWLPQPEDFTPPWLFACCCNRSLCHRIPRYASDPLQLQHAYAWVWKLTMFPLSPCKAGGGIQVKPTLQDEES